MVFSSRKITRNHADFTHFNTNIFVRKNVKNNISFVHKNVKTFVFSCIKM